jgi:hypothetical protein
MIASMEKPKWIFWQDQGKWRGHPEGCPDREIQAASFDELQFKVQQLSRDASKTGREVLRIERPKAETPDENIPRYVLSQDQGKWRGHLEGYPDSLVQGESFDEVQFKLYQLCRDRMNRKLPHLRKIA